MRIPGLRISQNMRRTTYSAVWAYSPRMVDRVPAFASLFESREVNTPRDVVLNPMAIPPFLRVNLHAVELHGEVNVIASGHAGHAALTHHLASLDQVPLVHTDMAEVAVDRLQAIAMIHNDAVAVDAERRRIDNAAIIRCFDTNVLRDGEIVSQVDLLIDLLALVDLVPQVGKGRFSLRMSLPGERLREQKPVCGLQAKLRQSLVIGPAHLGIDFDKTRNWIA